MSLKFAVGKKEVIEQIKSNVLKKEFNSKVELNDPNLDKATIDNLLEEFWKKKKTLSYKIKNIIVRKSICKMIKEQNIKITGLENLDGINGGAIITSNHFSPADSLPIRAAMKSINKKLYTVVVDTNIAMDGPIGALMNYADTIPVSSTSINYMTKVFKNELKKVLDKKDWVLIYPEEEMWFNYRKPRPPKRGAYYYAVSNNVPIVSCFIEIVDTGIKDTDEFNELQYILHILPAVYPSNENITSKQKEQLMLEQDYNQKVKAYEQAYGKKLDYAFNNSDIAGYRI